MINQNSVMKKLSKREKSVMWSILRKENESFEDLCNERDKIVSMIEHHEIVKNALYSQLEKWDSMLEEMFCKFIESELAMKIKK